MMLYTILQGINMHGIVCDQFTTWDPLTWDFTMQETVTMGMDFHEAVYNVDENR